MIEVRVADASELDAVLQTLTLAFAIDPPVRYLFSTPAAFLTGYPAFARAMGGPGAAHGGAWLAEGGAAAALWRPPGVEADSEALGELLGSMIEASKLPLMGELAEAVAQYHPHEPHWYLSMVGVDPARQGMGLGSAMLKAGLARVDADGLPAYLESSNPRNVPLYERFGFEVMGVIQPGDFPPLIPMLRPARGG
jgi:ribosomal protein S18 acetylase RimI-like enzyme